MPVTDQIPVNPGPIIGAGTRDIPSSVRTMPYMRSTLAGWFQPMTITVITQGPVVDGIVTQVERPFRTAGCIEPMKTREIKPGAGGVRAWSYYILYVAQEFVAAPNDKIVLAAKTYRVMGTRDYSEYGYRQYELELSYQ